VLVRENPVGAVEIWDRWRLMRCAERAEALPKPATVPAPRVPLVRTTWRPNADHSWRRRHRAFEITTLREGGRFYFALTGAQIALDA
jgi:hypothetical protein